MRLGLWALMLGLAAPAATWAADFRLMATGATSVMVADLGAISKDAAGVRHVSIYSGSFAPMQVNGKTFQFIWGNWAFDCQKGQFRSEGVDILGPDFTVLDHSDTMSRWDTPTGKPPPASDFATYCAASPGKASHAPKLNASEWHGAIQAALAMARAAPSEPDPAPASEP
jgi:hypothetical protein